MPDGIPSVNLIVTPKAKYIYVLTHSPIAMIRLLHDTVSMVSPQKCMKPPTSTKEKTTQIRTRIEAVTSARRNSVVMKIQPIIALI